MEVKVVGPRITVQYEITGKETDAELAQIKRTEKALEVYFANVWCDLMEEELGVTDTVREIE